MLRLMISVISHKPEEVVASNTSTRARQTLQTAFEAGCIGFKKNMVNPFNTQFGSL
jgi:hypothetical protein